MAKELTANFGANTTKFSAGVQKIKTELTNLNKVFDENQRKISKTNKEIKLLEKEQEQLLKETKANGTATAEQKNRLLELNTALAQAKTNVAALKTEQASLKSNIKSATEQLTTQNSAVEGASVAADKMNSMFGRLTTVVKGFIAVYGSKKLFEMLIGSSADMEQYEASLSTLIGNTEKAAELVNNLKNFTGNETPLTLDDTMSSATILINYGVEADNVIEKLRQLGDLSMGNAEKLDRVTLAYGQMLSKGKVTGEELRQMVEAGVPLTQALANSMGVTTSEISKMISKSEVGISDLNAAIESLTSDGGKFSGMMDKQAQTMNGLISKIKFNIEDFFRTAGDGAFSEIKQSFQDVLDEITRMKDNGEMAEIAQELSEGIANVIGFIKNAITIGWQFRDVITAGVAALIAFKAAISIGNSISTTVTVIKSFVTAVKAAKAAQVAFNAVGAANPYVAIAAAVLAVTGAITAFVIANNNASESLQELTEKTSQLSSEVESSVEKVSSLDKLSDKYTEICNSVDDNIDKKAELTNLQEQLNQLFGDEAEKIDLANGFYNEQIEKIKALSAEELALAKAKAQVAVNNVNEQERLEQGITYSDNRFNRNGIFSDENIRNALTEVGNNLDNVSIGTKGNTVFPGVEFPSIAPELDFEVSISGNAEEKLRAYQQIMAEFEKQGLQTTEYYGLIVASADEYAKKVEENKQAFENFDVINNMLSALTDTTNDNAKAAEKQSLSLKDWQEQADESIVTAEKIAEKTAENTKATSDLTSGYATLNKVFEEQNENGELSISTIMEIIDKGYSACLVIDKETGAVRLNEQAYRDLIQTKINVQQASLDLERQELNLMNVQLASQAATAAQARDDVRLSEIQSQIAANDARLAAIAATSGVYQQISNNPINTNADVNDKEKNKLYSNAYTAYKTEADKKLDLIKKELAAKKELRDETIKAIDDEIAARKRLNEDNDLQTEINAVKAQLKYSQLDDFSKGQLNKKLGDLYDQKTETEWQRNAEARKVNATSQYEAEEKKLTVTTESINASLKTVKQILDNLANGTQNVSNIINNTKNNTANINLANQALSMAQITRAVKDALMDDIVI